MLKAVSEGLKRRTNKTRKTQKAHNERKMQEGAVNNQVFENHFHF
jgi:hypothetical protein